MTTQETSAGRLQQAIESLLEDERLRSNLTDAEARVLLGWGQKQLEAAAAGAGAGVVGGGVDVAAARVRSAVRSINDLVDVRARLSEAELQQRLTELLANWRSAGDAAMAGGQGALVALRHDLSNLEFIERLTTLLSEQDTAAGPGGGRRVRLVQQGAPRRSISPVMIVAGIGALLFCCVLAVVGYNFVRGRLQSPPVAGTPTAAASPIAASWYQLYFTTPRYPDNTADHHGSLDEKLTTFINTAKTSVDMAIYQLDLPNVTQALLDAKQRGVTVRVVTDIDSLNDPKENPSFKRLQSAGISVVGGNPNSIMHDKFVVVDGKAVWTGSWNFTTNDTYRYNNNGILIQSAELARNYTTAFEKRWRDNTFGAQVKPGGTTAKLNVNGAPVENYFASEDQVTDRIVARLQAAQRSIDFMAFSFTENAIGDVVLAKAKAGVKVRGVFETTGSETQYSEYGRMRAAKIDVLQDGNPYLMHHKVFIIDGKTVIFGSFNFSANAQNSNDENLLIVDDLALSSQFTAEFERLYAQAKNSSKK